MAYLNQQGGNCLTGTRFTMSATLLHQDENYNPYPDIDPDEYGTWTDSQDPLTGQIVKIWTPYTDPADDPATPDVVETVIHTIPCVARGIVDGGIRVAGTTEWFGADYRNIDFVKMWVPPTVRISKRDRVVNITDQNGRIMWHNEEYEPINPNIRIDISDPETYNLGLKATLFNVNGVTPLFNAFNRPVEQFVLLENAEIQESATV
jgi:hypothetical protein